MTAEALRRGEEKDLHLPVLRWLSLPVLRWLSLPVLRWLSLPKPKPSITPFPSQPYFE
jgi:hypothetical protein